MSNWIKHTPGEKRPVPKKWLKAVKDAEGWTFFAGGKALKPDGSSGGDEWTSGFAEASFEWRSKNAITHFKLKKRYREQYEAMTTKTPFQKFCDENGYDDDGVFVTLQHKRGNKFYLEAAGNLVTLKLDDESLAPLMAKGSEEWFVNVNRLTQPKWTPHTPGDPAPVPFEWIEQTETGGVIQRVLINENKMWNFRTAYKVKPQYHIQHLQLMKEKEAMTTPASPEITREVTEMITVSCSETGRSVTLSKARYEEKREVVDWWVRGGEVEFMSSLGAWATYDFHPDFGDTTQRYRIKQHNHSPGEVWEVDCGTDDGDENYRPVVWVTDDNGVRAYFFADYHVPGINDMSSESADWPKRYVAKSIAEYYGK